MPISRALLHAAMVFTMAVLCAAGALAQNDTEIIAEVGGVKLTMADLQQAEASQLLQARYQYYQAASKALDELINQKLLEQKAKQEHQTVDELLDRDIKSQLKDPTEDQMKVYYEGLETDQPYAAVRDKILAKIRQVRTDRLRAAYLKTLRAQADVHILLSGPVANVNLENANWAGLKDAPVLVVEFADYECPYCQRVAPDIKKVLDEFGSKVAFAYKDFPLPMHSHAEKAAEAARCAGKQGKFWQFHDELFRTKELDVDQLKGQAHFLGLNSAEFDQCLDSSEMAGVVAQDRAEGVRLGLTGTPSFFINRHYFSGALDYAALRLIVDQQLSSGIEKTQMAARK